MLLSYVKHEDPIVDAEFCNDVIERLKGLKYTAVETDYFNLGFFITRSILKLLTFTNQKYVPVELRASLIDYIVGEFMLFQIENDVLPENFFAETDSVKSIKEGDTEVTFAGGGKSARDVFLTLLAGLTSREEWLCYRRLKW